jgi:hypothetical protein
MAKGKGKPPERLKPLITLRGEPEWLEWLKRYATDRGLQLTTIIDIAVREQAKRDGFDEPMPKRFTR